MNRSYYRNDSKQANNAEIAKMAFWSGQRLARELKHGIVSDFDSARIDCASYALRMGPEYFVTADSLNTAQNEGIITRLEPNGSFKIRSGQFASLLTEETVSIPARVLAFISMKSRYKFQGLINVSGFHVDPGYKGRLIFAVYNAGPTDVQLRRGDEMFLIWLSDLDDSSELPYRKNYSKNKTPRVDIEASLVSGLSGHVYSPMTLVQTARKLEETVRNHTAEISEAKQRYKYLIGSVLTGIAIVITLAALAITYMDAYDEDLSRATRMEIASLEKEITVLRDIVDDLASKAVSDPKPTTVMTPTTPPPAGNSPDTTK